MKLKTFLVFVFLFFLTTGKSLAAISIVPEPNGSGPNGFASLSDLTIVFANVISVVSTFAGFGVLIMFIRGGIGYITAQGDPKAVSAARSSLTWAVIGSVVIVSAFLVISLLVGFFAIPGLGKFCIPKAGQAISSQCK